MLTQEDNLTRDRIYNIVQGILATLTVIRTKSHQ